MKLTIEFNRRLMVITGISVVAGGAICAVAYFLTSAYQQRKVADMQANYAACAKKKEQYLSDHRFDSMVKEQEWIMNHPDDPRLKGAPSGKQLQEELNGEYKGTRFDLKEGDIPSFELKAFTGRGGDYSLNDSDSGSSVAQQILSDG
jgi:Na+-transporting NADH:ubiquinone oxidoreductase subunit NqrC